MQAVYATKRRELPVNLILATFSIALSIQTIVDSYGRITLILDRNEAK